MNADKSLPYQSPAAFRRALTDRLRAVAAPHGPWPLADLQRQFAYDRLIARIYLLDDGWVVKGATALLARRLASRHTVDLDIYRSERPERAADDLRRALHIDAGDWFTFEATATTPIGAGVIGTRTSLVANLGVTPWTRFHVDLVGAGVRMTGIPDAMPPLTPVDIPGLWRPSYRVYPIVDHIADKTCAIIERRPPENRPSTRFKDLVDLVDLTRNGGPTAECQRTALASESDRRGISLPSGFTIPDRALWERGYAAEARRAVIATVLRLDQALELVCGYLDPILAGTATGRWDPVRRSWEGGAGIH